MRNALRLFLIAGVGIGAWPAPPPAAEGASSQDALRAPSAPEIAGLVPGATRRAEVELVLGPGSRHGLVDRVAYEPPAALDGAEKIEIDYFRDQRIARVKIILSPPISRKAVAANAGRPVHRDQDHEGRLVEYFYPSLRAFVHEGATTRSPVRAVVYLSPQFMADIFAERANDAIRSDAWSTALTECDKAVLVAPDYARGYRCRAVVVDAQGKSEQALEHWLTATRAPLGLRYKISAWTELAAEFHERGWRERAWSTLNEARQADPSSPFPYFTEAVLRVQDNEEDKAVSAWKQAAERAGDDLALLQRCAKGIYDLKRYRDAAPYYEKLADLGFGDPFSVSFRAGFTLSRAGRHEEAIPYYNKALELEPNHLWSNNNLGVAYLETSEPAKALPLFEKAIGLDPGELKPARNRVRALMELDRGDEAADFAKDLVEDFPNHSSLYVLVAEAYAVQRKESRAMKWIQRAFEEGYRNCDALRSNDYLLRVRERKRKDFEELCRVK